ncbi:MAG: hypothetical protein BKP49_10530 [Treponema sp. CETP13]|nr:MAG: hypothetical protein BKP49_10530 [Treponema sp. CETP13]
MKKILEDLLNEEKELQFDSFNELDAWKLGTLLVNKALSDKLPVTIDITRSGKQLFHVSLPGTTVDNDIWIKRKINLVNRFGHSSFYLGQFLKSINKTIEEAFLVSESDYAPHGGSFPIIIGNSGIIGTITVSGLQQEEDHKLVVSTIRSYINKES